MKILRTVAELREWRQAQSGSIGFVPTMGALHAGHASLLRRAREENDLCVLSVFVNPTQFNQAADFEKYPQTFEADAALARSVGVDALFIPRAPGELYPDEYCYRVTETEFSKQLCGAFRPGHFEGVLSVVMKLLNLVRPDRAYFGEKDRQQLTLIEGMVRAFFMDVKIVPYETVREADGLAMSSRNLRLRPEDRERAPLIYRALRESPTAEAARRRLEEAGFRVEYLEDRQGHRYVAAWCGPEGEEVRLIDHVQI